MKKYCLLILVTCFIICGCSKKSSLEGNWETVALIKNGQEQKLYKSNINFSASESVYYAKGLAGFNLFTVTVQDKGTSIEVFKMVNTGFMGSDEEMEYEDMFYDAFLNSDSYKIKKDTLYFYNHDKKLELRLQKM